MTEAEEEEEIVAHLGTVTLNRMKDLLDDKTNWSNENFRRAMGDYVKPAFLIDGQHRVAAAAKLGDNGLPFIVCGLYDPPWEEQVFQFTVVNLKPKRIPPALITAIAGLSLTREESDQVELRLSQAGVRMDEVTIMSLIAYDDASPFCDLVDMAVQGSGSGKLLGYGAMKRIAKVWYRASRASLTQIAKRVFLTNNASSARRQWRDERIWFDFFCRFWAVVRDTYPDLWGRSESNRLFIGAHLWALQEVLLKAADGQVQSHWVIEADNEQQRRDLLMEKLIEVVRTTLAYFPKDLWTIAWARKSQDTNAGRQELVDLFDKFVDEGKKSGRVWKNWRKEPWFKAEA